MKVGLKTSSGPKFTDRMLEMGIDGDLMRWTLSFLADSKVQLVVDGFQCQVQPISTGVPQASPVSPILFVIYLSGVSKAIEEAVPGIKVLSFADDLGLVAPAGSVEGPQQTPSSRGSSYRSPIRRGKDRSSTFHTQAGSAIERTD